MLSGMLNSGARRDYRSPEFPLIFPGKRTESDWEVSHYRCLNVAPHTEVCMKNRVVGSVCLTVSLLVPWPSDARADAVIKWNENAAKAATAACLHLSGNGLAE